MDGDGNREDATATDGREDATRTYDGAHFDDVYAADDGDPWGFWESEYEHQKFERTLAALRARRDADELDAILDLGCGNGAKTARLVDAYPDVEIVGVDVSAAALEVARDRAPAARYVEDDVGAVLARTDRRFDAILDVECLCYLAADHSVTELLELAGQLRSALAEGGLFVGTHVHMPPNGVPTIEDDRTARVVREVLESELKLVGRERYVDVKEVALDEDEPAEQPYEVWTMESG